MAVMGESERYRRDPEERSKKCLNCGHLKRSHKHANEVRGKKGYYYSTCRKSRCSCDQFVPEGQEEIE